MYAYGPSLLNLPPVCGPLLKSSLNLVQPCFYFTLWFSGPKKCGMWLFNLGWNPQPLQWKASLNHWTPGKSQESWYLIESFYSRTLGAEGCPGRAVPPPTSPKDGTPAWVCSGIHQGTGRASHQLSQSQKSSHPQLRSLLQLTALASLPFVKWEKYPYWLKDLQVP